MGIPVNKTYSFFEVEPANSDEIINALNKSRFNDRRVVVEIAQEKSGEKNLDEKPGKKFEKRSGRKHKERNAYKGQEFRSVNKYRKKVNKII